MILRSGVAIDIIFLRYDKCAIIITTVRYDIWYSRSVGRWFENNIFLLFCELSRVWFKTPVDLLYFESIKYITTSFHPRTQIFSWCIDDIIMLYNLTASILSRYVPLPGWFPPVFVTFLKRLFPKSLLLLPVMAAFWRLLFSLLSSRRYRLVGNDCLL